MKNLKTIRKRNSSEEGFSMVTAAGFGLVIMMIGLTIMSRSMKDNTISASQKINNRSLAAAESGVSMYLSLLNKKGGIALPSKTSDNWATSGLSADEIAKTQGWQDIAGNSEKGQYKLISYVPDGNGKAILKVQGRVNQTSTGNGEDISTGMTTVEAIIGVNERAGATSPRAAAIQITGDPAAAAAAATTAATAAATAAAAVPVSGSSTISATTTPVTAAAVDANTTASTANTTASAANTATTPDAPATVTAAAATQSAIYATNSAASAVGDAQTAASAPGATTPGTSANTAAVTAATEAATATVAAATANTAAAAANTAASTNSNTATTAAATAAAAATTAATAADNASTAANPSGTPATSPTSTSSPATGTTANPVTASTTATTEATEAVAAANTAITAATVSNVQTASAANTEAAAANTIASVANTATTATAPATIAAATATESATSATQSAISALNSANAAANATSASAPDSTAAAAAVTAAAAAANAATAAAAANTAAAAANTAATSGNTATAQTAATTAATAATTAATAAASASTAAQLVAPAGTTRFPGLWLINGPNNTTSTNFNQSYNAYGLVTNTPATSLWTSPGKIATQIEVPNSVSRTAPPFAMSKCLLANSNPTINPSFLNSVDLATRIIRNGDVTFPTTTDRAGPDGVYRYYASNLNLEGNTKVRFSASAKVIVHLQGDMITKGNIDIVPCAGSATCNLNNLVIYGHKANGQLLIKGTNTVGAFIIAPTYSAGVAGGGNGEGYKGALWARNWATASNSNKFVVNQDGNENQNLACPYNNPSIQVISQAVVPNS